MYSPEVEECHRNRAVNDDHGHFLVNSGKKCHRYPSYPAAFCTENQQPRQNEKSRHSGHMNNIQYFEGRTLFYLQVFRKADACVVVVFCSLNRRNLSYGKPFIEIC